MSVAEATPLALVTAVVDCVPIVKVMVLPLTPVLETLSTKVADRLTWSQYCLVKSPL